MMYLGISKYNNVGITTNIPDLWNIMVSNAHIAVSIYFCFCIDSIIKIKNDKIMLFCTQQHKYKA